MKSNIIDYITLCATSVILLIYFCTGMIADVICKVIAFIICSIFIIFAIICLPLINTNKFLSVFHPIYMYGGKWKFIPENYYITFKLIDKIIDYED